MGRLRAEDWVHDAVRALLDPDGAYVPSERELRDLADVVESGTSRSYPAMEVSIILTSMHECPVCSKKVLGSITGHARQEVDPQHLIMSVMES